VVISMGKRLSGWCFMVILAIFPWKSPH